MPVEGEEPAEGEDRPEAGSKRRRKYSPVVEKMNKADNPLCDDENAEELQDLEDLDDLEDLEGLKRKGIKYTPFKL